MDPNATLIELLWAIEAGNRNDAMSSLDDLMTWIERGGFVPNTQAAAATLQERMRDETV